MGSKPIEFWFEFASTYSYLSAARLPAVAQAAGVPFVGLWLDAPVATLRARVEQRAGDASDATPAVVEAQVAAGAGSLGWARIDASGDPAEALEAARAAIQSRQP